MSLIKSNKRSTPMLGGSLMNDPFFSDMFQNRPGLINRFLSGNGDSDLPAVNIKDHEKNIEIELAAPGLTKDDFEITMNNGILTISSEKETKKEEEKEGYVRKEFSYNSFSRSFSLPENIDEEKDVQARYQDGVLKLMLHKKEGSSEKPPKKIKIS